MRFPHDAQTDFAIDVEERAACVKQKMAVHCPCGKADDTTKTTTAVDWMTPLRCLRLLTGTILLSRRAKNYSP